MAHKLPSCTEAEEDLWWVELGRWLQARAMEPIVNLEETPGKVVGRIRRRSPAEFLERMGKLFQSMGVRLPFPKGVYRFKTFEEADEWEMKHRIAAALKRSRERQR